MLTEVPIPVYNITAPAVVATPATRAKFKGFLMSGGSAGTLTFNDCATLAEASAANQILSLPYGQAAIATVGDSNWLDWPLLNGLVVSSVPTGAVLAVVYTQFVGA